MDACFQQTCNDLATMKTGNSWPANDVVPSSPGAPSFRLSTAASFHDDSLVPPHPSQRSALPPQAQFGDARFPVIITQDPRASSQVVGTDPRGHVPLNTPVPVETDTFVGRMCNLIRGCPGTPDAEFRGTKLQAKSIIQGMFKTPMAANDIWVGQELLKPPLLPASFQRLVFTTAAKMFSSTYRVMVEGEGDSVGYLNPLLALAATINVSLPGQQPDMRGAHEDARLLDARLADKTGQPVSSVQRQRFFDKPSNMQDVVFSTQHVYTFVITQSIVDMPTYKLKLGAFINMDLCPILNGQPLQMMCKNVQTDQVIMSLLVWHKHLSYPPGRQRRQSDADTISSCSYRHSRASSQDASDNSSVNGLCTNSGSLYTDSSIGSSIGSSSSSLGSIDDSCADSSVGDDSSSEAGTGFDSADGCESDYHSCCDEDDAEGCQYQLGPQQQQQQQSAAAALYGQAGVHAAGADAQPPLLQTALSAPAELLGGAADLSDVPVRVTVVAARAAGLDAAAVAAAPKAARKSSGGRAVAAVVSAARRVAARLRPLPAPRPRRNKSCPGFAL